MLFLACLFGVGVYHICWLVLAFRSCARSTSLDLGFVHGFRCFVIQATVESITEPDVANGASGGDTGVRSGSTGGVAVQVGRCDCVLWMCAVALALAVCCGCDGDGVL